MPLLQISTTVQNDMLDNLTAVCLYASLKDDGTTPEEFVSVELPAWFSSNGETATDSSQDIVFYVPAGRTVASVVIANLPHDDTSGSRVIYFDEPVTNEIYNDIGTYVLESISIGLSINNT